MAKQKGIIKLCGTLGDTNYYYRKGKPVSRKSGGGFNGKSIKQSPNMQRVRENSSEFGEVSKIKKCLRLALEPYLKQLHDTTLHGRMMGLLQDIKVLDTVSERGKRNVFNGLRTQEGRKLFTAFTFTPNVKIKEMLGGNYSLSPASLASLEIDNLNTNFGLPASATSVQLQLIVVTFDFENLKTATHLSSTFMVSKFNPPASVALSLTTLPDLSLPTFVFLHFQEFQELNGLFLPLKATGCTELVGLEIQLPENQLP